MADQAGATAWDKPPGRLTADQLQRATLMSGFVDDEVAAMTADELAHRVEQVWRQ